MKAMKKLGVIAVALAAMLLIGAAAFAGNYDTGVTVTGIKEGNTLKLYKIADASVNSSNEIEYTMATGLPTAYDTVAEINAVDKSDAAAIRAMADTFAAQFVSNSTDAAYQQIAGNGNSASIAAVAPGYYLAMVSGTNDTGIIYQSMLINTVMRPSGSIYVAHDPINTEVKHEELTVVKQEKKSAADDTLVTGTDQYRIGQDIDFVITSSIANYPSNATAASFWIADAPTGLTDKINTAKVYVKAKSATDWGDEVAAGETTFAKSAQGNGFKIEFANTYLLAHPGSEVKVTYTATLTGPVNADGQTSNTASIYFDPNPFEADPAVTPKGKKEATATQQTYGLIFEKVDENDQAQAGATFALYDATGTNPITKNGTAMTCTTSVVNDHAYVIFEGLEAGTYTVKETSAPAGYKTVVDFSMVTSAAASTGDNPTTGAKETYFTVATGAVKNEKGADLPTTGGMGTTIFYILGAILVIGAGTLLAVRRRR